MLYSCCDVYVGQIVRFSAIDKDNRRLEALERRAVHPTRHPLSPFSVILVVLRSEKYKFVVCSSSPGNFLLHRVVEQKE